MILIVEDDPGIRESLKLALELEGYSVAVAENGQQGLEVIENGKKPCLILLDLMMPVMNGWQFLEKHKSEQSLSEIPVVVVSALAEKSNQLGAKAYLRKPVEIDQLLDTVSQFC